MEKPTKEQIEKVKLTLNKIPDFKDVEILDTWFENICRLEEELREKRNYLNKVKRERKKQPEITVQTIICNEVKKIRNYQININAKGEPFYIQDW